MAALSFTLDEKQVRIFPGSAGSPEVFLNCFTDDGEAIHRLLSEQNAPAHTLITVSGFEWNRDLSPWPAPSFSQKEPPFTGGADEYLTWMQQSLFPGVEEVLQEFYGESYAETAYRAIAGYSMAGLFAVYSLYRTDAWARAASMSGSLWYPDIVPFVKEHRLRRKPDCVYFSLGGREALSGIPALKLVQENTESIKNHFRDLGIRTTLVMNRGGHATQSEKRTASGILWMLSQKGFTKT